MRKNPGFTLIELMVVMAIIAILATAGLSAYTGYLKKARDTARKEIARQPMIKVEERSVGGIPPTTAELVAFLEAENFAFAPLPMIHPLVAQVSGIVDTILGTSFALVDIDPLSGAGNCYYYYNDNYNANCVFTYGTIPDGTYFITYSIEDKDNMSNFWQLPYTLYGSNGNFVGGNVIGTNPYLVTRNSAYGGEMDSAFWDTNNFSTRPTDIAIISVQE